MTAPTILFGQARPLPLTTPPFPNETLKSYIARLALLNRIPHDRVLRRFYSAESPLEEPNLLAARSGQSPSSLRRALPELTTSYPWSDRGSAEITRLWACQLCVAAHTGRNDWKVEVWGIKNHLHLCVKHRHWTDLSYAYYAQSFVGPADGQFSLARASEIVHAQRVLHRLCRRWNYRRTFPAFEECARFWRNLAGHGYAADRVEQRLDLIIPNRRRRERRSEYRKAALFPDIVEATKLFASPFWLAQALGNYDELQYFQREFERRLPPEGRLRTTAIPWFARELAHVAQQVANEIEVERRRTVRLAALDPPDRWPYRVMRQLLRRTPSHAR